MTSIDMIAALGLGLAGSGHCLGMCGGIAIAIRPDPNAHSLVPLAYHLGRVISYSMLGAALGGAAGAVQIAEWTIGLRIFAAVLLIAMGLQVLAVWRGIERLERVGSIVWRRIAPISQTLIPPRHLGQAALLGGLWGFMPCGLIYSALGWSAANGGNAIDSGVLMLLFGIGTLPSMLGATLTGQRIELLLKRKGFKRVIGTGLVLSGIWTLINALMLLEKLSASMPMMHH